MATLDLRKKVLTYINNADERLLKLVKALAESYQKDALEDFILNEEQYRMLDQRRQAHLKGESKSFTWKEVKQNVRKSVQK